MKLNSKMHFLFFVLTLFIFHDSLAAQIYSRDFMVSQPVRLGNQIPPKYSIDVVVLTSNGFYDANGEPTIWSGSKYTEQNAIFALQLYQNPRYNIGFSFTLGVVAASGSGGRKNVGDPWIWLHFRPSENYPIELRFALNFNTYGDDANHWPEDNKLDIGLAAGKQFKDFGFESVLSYRLRSKMQEINHLNFGNYDMLGNEVHFRISPNYLIDSTHSAGAILIGYRGWNKYFENKVIANSNSSKTAIGIQYKRKIHVGSLSAIFLYDIHGRYDRKAKMFIFRFAF